LSVLFPFSSPLFSSLPHLAQQQIQRADGDLQLAQGEQHRNDHQDQGDGKAPLSTREPTREQGKHAHHAQQQAEHAKDLHVADQVNTVTQVGDLRQQVFIAFGLVFAVQVADDGGQRVEAVRVRQHKQGHGGKQQSRGGD
jgi:hypothetical protein